MATPHENPEGFVAILAAIGAGIGLGKLLASSTPLTIRMIVGRVLVSAGIGAGAGATTLLFPTAEPIVLYGVAAGLASLGSSGFEAAVHHYIGGRK